MRRDITTRARRSAYKIACEVAPVIEDLVARHGDDLGPHAPQAPVAGAPPAWAQTVMQFNALTMALQGTGKSAAEAYQYFTSMPDPRLKLVGIQGRLETGDASALLDLEKNLSRGYAGPQSRIDDADDQHGRRREGEPARGTRAGTTGHGRNCACPESKGAPPLSWRLHAIRSFCRT